MIDTEPLKRFVREHFRLSKRMSLTDDLQLLPNLVDAFGVIELADFVEEAYGIVLTREDLLAYEENFRCISAIAALVERRQREQLAK